MSRTARWWVISSLDRAVHLLVPEGDHLAGVLTARCGHRLPTAAHQHDQPPPGPPCEPCRVSFLADFTTAQTPARSSVELCCAPGSPAGPVTR